MNVEAGHPDYYALLQVDPDCNARTLEIAYHYFAKLYHPDNPDTADLDKFSAVVDAYKVLRDEERRAEYDARYFSTPGRTRHKFAFEGEQVLDERTAVSDAEIHARILLALYKKRREQASDAGVVGWLLQETLDCSDEQFEFHIWYLKSKGFIQITEQGTMEITIDGVDHVITTSKASVEKLRIAHAAAGDEQ